MMRPLKQRPFEGLFEPEWQESDKDRQVRHEHYRACGRALRRQMIKAGTLKPKGAYDRFDRFIRAFGLSVLMQEPVRVAFRVEPYPDEDELMAWIRVFNMWKQERKAGQ